VNDDDRLPESSDEDEAVAPPDGTLVISTWNEPNQPHGFRARLIVSQGVDAQPRFIPCADREEVLNIVRRWLYAQAGSSTRTEPGG
jgi:hypothetical protein